MSMLCGKRIKGGDEKRQKNTRIRGGKLDCVEYGIEKIRRFE